MLLFVFLNNKIFVNLTKILLNFLEVQIYFIYHFHFTYLSLENFLWQSKNFEVSCTSYPDTISSN